MISIKRCYFILPICAALISAASGAFAIDDGLSYDKKIEGKYITVYYPSGIDASRLAEQLNIRASDKIITGQPLKSKGSYEEELAQALDTLFMRVSDILDMRLYSLKTSIKICKTDVELNNVYNHLFNSSLGPRRSFYVYDLNSIYVSEAAFQPGIIGHELSHAVISHYFSIPAPVKVQEVLSMYVEYDLRRAQRQ